jgi:starch synthase (maltosyl-transferring)
MFPRSAAGKPGLHGTFDDCIRRLPYVAGMEFDILYLPPIHPIGTTHRKGKNNAVECGPGEPGSPWAIGSDEGGHKAIHPALGTIAEFRKLVTAAQQHGLAIALDIAFQCSPDHPYVKEHPDWFQHRSDGSIRYAENPPKEYQDIYPFDFESKDWRALWAELKSVFEYWIGQGVTLFRVDNPHTKPFAFWEWLMAELHRDYPEVILLAEAFTRPKIMDHLARIGFSQSYTYFTWRNSKRELTEYMTELTKTEVAEYFRPNLWPNTPDILHAYLQQGGRPAFAARLVLAATLAANYGIYGPAYELADNKPLTPGSEEYLNSEKYEIRQWDIERSDSLRELIKRVNMSRRANPALQSNRGLVFHDIENDRLLCYSKATDDKDNVVLIIVNLDPFNAQSGWTALNLNALGLSPGQTYVAHDLLTGTQHVWKDERNFVEISPRRQPAHLFVIDCKGAS